MLMLEAVCMYHRHLVGTACTVLTTIGDANATYWTSQHLVLLRVRTGGERADGSSFHSKHLSEHNSQDASLVHLPAASNPEGTNHHDVQ